jgi:RimJ/RimL family protein N-acetyltransferase
MPRGWEGEKVRLVPLDKARHLDNALAWVNDPEATAWALNGDWPVSRLAEEEFFDRMMRGSESEVAFAVETLDGEHIGFAHLYQIDRAQGVAYTGILIGRRDLWGRGYGTDASRVRARYAFEVMGLRLLLSEVMADNAGSLEMLRRTGYREVGRIPRRWWKRGAFRDAVLLAMERPPGPV